MSSELHVIGAEELRARLPMVAAVDALEEAFRTKDPGSGPLRTHVETPRRHVAADAGRRRGRCRREAGLPHTGEPGSRPPVHPRELRALRRRDPGSRGRPRRLGAHGAPDRRRLGARHATSEPPDAHRLVVFGAGVQATSHLEAMCVVRPVTELVVVSRSRSTAQSLVEDGLGRGLAARLGESDAVADADLICTCTTAEEPAVRWVARCRPGFT